MLLLANLLTLPMSAHRPTRIDSADAKRLLVEDIEIEFFQHISIGGNQLTAPIVQKLGPVTSTMPRQEDDVGYTSHPLLSRGVQYSPIVRRRRRHLLRLFASIIVMESRGGMSIIPHRVKEWF